VWATLGISACLLAACSGGSSPTSPTAQSTGTNTTTPTITSLTNQPPGGDSGGLALQLTDGSVMVQSSSDYTLFYKLSPDAFGSYVNGTWTQLASLPPEFAPDDGNSAVLADGRVLMIGAEDIQHSFSIIGLSNMGAIYDPVADSWTMIPAPDGIPYIGDAPIVVLPDGRVLLGDKLTTQMAIFDPSTMQWTTVDSTGKSDFFAEEGFTLLPNGNVLTIDVANLGHAEHYVPSTKQWISDGTTPVMLATTQTPPATNGYVYGPAPIQIVGGVTYGPGPVGTYYPPGEIGPAVLMPDGSVFATGSSNDGAAHTAIYHPGAQPSDPGTWTVGPDLPNGDQSGDTSAALLPNGHALIQGIPSGMLYEFDGHQILSGTDPMANGYLQFLLPLPTGETLMISDIVRIYTAAGGPNPAWKPTITNCPATLARSSSYLISGTQFNGLSTGAGVGDEEGSNTSFPLVRITNTASGHVVYARTHDHSTMAVATGAQSVSTHFDVPANAETGPASLVVVANGIASQPTNVTVQ
jgi:hypothetical protein